MKKNIELRMVKHFAELAQLTLGEVMKDDSLSDKEFNSIREAHDSIASARDTIVRLTKPQRMVSAEAKENGYSEPEELTEFEQRIMRLVNRSTFQRRTVDEDGARYVAGLLLPYAKKQLEQQKSK